MTCAGSLFSGQFLIKCKNLSSDLITAGSETVCRLKPDDLKLILVDCKHHPEFHPLDDAPP
jgi:hypothetical protein